MTRNEQQMYSDVTSIRKSLKKIANALETNVPTTPKPKDIPGFEGTLDALDVLCDIKTITDEYATLNQSNEALIARHKNKLSSEFHNDLGTSNKELHDLKLHTDEGKSCDDDHVHNDYLNDLVTDMTKEQYVKFFLDMDFGFALSDTSAFKQHCYVLDYEECLDAIKSALHITGENDIVERIGSDIGIRVELDEPTSSNPDPAGYGKKDEYVHGCINDSDNDIRSAAYSYEASLDSETQYTSKKDCILDYVTNEFGITGARYTDIIKFAYYLGEHNAPKFDNGNRGYYSCAFNVRLGGHLIQGGKDQLVKGINKEGKERYFALSSVDSFTDYYKRIA